MDSPGIEVRPIINLAGEHDFNQVFFTDVRVPKDRRLGEENEGWTVARYLLLYEHGAGIVRAAAELRRRVRWVHSLARAELDGRGGSLEDDVDFAQRLAELEIDVTAVDFAADQLILTTDPAASPGAAAELLNIRMRELDQALTELAVEAVGYYGLVDQKQARRVITEAAAIGPAHALMPMAVFLGQLGATIAGGTPDIHRNNLSKSLLR
jgi:acyl-CoA dehydrogenase